MSDTMLAFQEVDWGEFSPVIYTILPNLFHYFVLYRACNKHVIYVNGWFHRVIKKEDNEENFDKGNNLGREAFESLSFH